MNKPLVIYHADCADGFGAAFAAWTVLGDNAEYVPVQYGKDIDRFSVLENGEFDSDFTILNREIFILDFSFPYWIMKGLFDLAKKVVWLDHHKTAFEMYGVEQWIGRRYEGYPENHVICLDSNKSGAYLAWQHFHPGEGVPMFIRHIDDYDRWQFKIEGTKAFNKALCSLAPWSFKQWQHELDSTWRYGSADGLEGLPVFIREGEVLLRAHNQNVQAVLKDATVKCVIKVPSFKGQNCEDTNYPYSVVTGLAANAPQHLHSDVGHELAKQSGTFGLCWLLGNNGKAWCSLRSVGDYDVSVIAKAFGGGGHASATGFEIDVETLLGWLK